MDSGPTPRGVSRNDGLAKMPGIGLGHEIDIAFVFGGDAAPEEFAEERTGFEGYFRRGRGKGQLLRDLRLAQWISSPW